MGRQAFCRPAAGWGEILELQHELIQRLGVPVFVLKDRAPAHAEQHRLRIAVRVILQGINPFLAGIGPGRHHVPACLFHKIRHSRQIFETVLQDILPVLCVIEQAV